MQIDYPEAYKLGYIYFYDLKFKVNSNVLIPRIETEKIIDLVKSYVDKDKQYKVLDVGTGSGCISISLAKELDNIDVTAIDISKDALGVAKENADTHNVNINFINNDLLEGINTHYDIIVSNLPYIPSDYIKELDKSVRDYEPILALDGGKDGFELYRKLFKQIIDNKINPELIIIELDDTHSEIAIEEGKKYFNDYNVSIEKDKYGYDRFLVIS